MCIRDRYYDEEFSVAWLRMPQCSMGERFGINRNKTMCFNQRTTVLSTKFTKVYMRESSLLIHLSKMIVNNSLLSLICINLKTKMSAYNLFQLKNVFFFFFIYFCCQALGDLQPLPKFHSIMDKAFNFLLSPPNFIYYKKTTAQSISTYFPLA